MLCINVYKKLTIIYFHGRVSGTHLELIRLYIIWLVMIDLQKCCYYNPWGTWNYGNSYWYFYSYYWWFWYDWWSSWSWVLTNQNYASGSMLLYHPWYFPNQYQQFDALPKQWCCLQSDNCNYYYQHRPVNYCWNYRFPRPGEIMP